MNITKLLVVVFIAALCDNVGASNPRGMHNDTKLMDQKLNLVGIGDIIGDITDRLRGIIGNITRPINTTSPTLPNNTSPAPSPEGGLVEIVPSLAPQGEAPLSGGNIGVPSLAPEGEASTGGSMGTAPSPLSDGIVGVAPSRIQDGGAINGTEPPLSGGIIASPPSPIVTEAPVSGSAIGVAPSLPPLGGGTEPPLIGGAIGVAPSLLPIGGFTEPPLSGDDMGVAPSLLPIGGATEPPLSGGGVIGVVPPPQSREAPAANDIESSIVVNIRMSHLSTEGGIDFSTNNFGNDDVSNGGSRKEP